MREARAFLIKFNNDRVLNAAAGLAYTLLLALIPIAIALISILGLILGSFDRPTLRRLIEALRHMLPPIIPSNEVLQVALSALARQAGALGLLAIGTALFGGSRLFIAIEDAFDIIYRTRLRSFLSQNIMAILMLLVYIILTPLLIFTTSLPGLLLELTRYVPLHRVPGLSWLTRYGPLLGMASMLGGLFVSYLLFQIIYLVVPNRAIFWRKSWPGAVVAAALLEIFLSLFPFYTTNFLGSYTGNIGFAVILLLFFYYFALILLLGAEINAFFIERIQPLPGPIAEMLHRSIHETRDEKTTVHSEPPADASGGM